jgi:hypothetical protein
MLPTLEEKADASFLPGLQSGKALVVPSDFHEARFCFTNNDHSMMQMYNLCDEAGPPRYLMDKLLT